MLKERVESRVRWRVTAIPAARWTDAHIEPGQVALWWLGHAGFAIRSASRRILIDPYLSDSLAIKNRGRVRPHDGLTLYHSGDCVPYPGLAERLAGRNISAALLPVSGRDDGQRAAGAPRNFHLEEAVRLTEELAIPVLVPHHFGVFDVDTTDLSILEARAARPGPTRLLVPDVDHGLVLQRD